MMKAPAGVQLPKHHHTGTVMVYTIEGKWKYGARLGRRTREHRVRNRRIGPHV